VEQDQLIQDNKKPEFRGFYGNHQHALDAKNRAFVPRKFKGGLPSGFMLTKGFDDCLIGYSYDDWNKLTQDLKEIPFTDIEGREFIRFFVGSVEECVVDSQGRFSIPAGLRDYAHLSKDIVFVGMMSCFEIWDNAVWKNVSEKYDYNVDIKAQKMQKYLNKRGVSVAVV